MEETGNHQLQLISKKYETQGLKIENVQYFLTFLFYKPELLHFPFLIFWLQPGCRVPIKGSLHGAALLVFPIKRI